MEHTKDRVLAYRLATVLSKEELEEVSAGQSNQVHPTFRITGSYPAPDTVFDFN